MRRLLYVPVMHEEADMGSEATALTLQSAALSGHRRWLLHQETVREFWESIRAFLRSFDPARLKLYQDGLAAGGETGQRIVEEAARRGSKNYQLFAELLDGGAELRKTEDPLLLLSEHQRIHRSMQQESSGESRRDTEPDRLRWGRLMKERDRFIGETITATLEEGGLAVLFIGAGHSVASFLANDISVEMVKDPAKVTAYFQELFLNRDDDKKLEELRHYLTSPVITAHKDGSAS